MGSSFRHRRRLFLAFGLPFALALTSIFSACAGEIGREPMSNELSSALESPLPVKPLAGSVNLENASWRLVEAAEIGYGQSAVALDNGRLLLAGGQVMVDDVQTTETTYLFDPRTDAFTTVSPLRDSRSQHGAVKLVDGRVLVFGGEQFGSEPYLWLRSSELFDPATSAWSDAPDMAWEQWNPSVTALSDGRALLLGGFGDGPTSAAQIFDPGDGLNGIWTSGLPLPTELENHTASSLPDGAVWVAGGRGTFGPSQGVYVFKPWEWAWSERDHMLEARSNHTATLLADGRVLVVGGLNSDFMPIGSVEIHDPSGNDEPSEAADLLVGRAYHTAALLPDGRVIVVGGGNSNEGMLRSSEIYDPATNSWTLGPELNEPREFQTMVMAAGRLIVVGGTSMQTESPASLEVLELGGTLGGTLGEACSEDSECTSGFCVDGFCCDSRCDGACIACAASMKASGPDGTCGPAKAGSNPRDVCRDEGAAFCRMTGTCDGAGVCALYEDGTECGEGMACTAGQCKASPDELCEGLPNGTPCGDDDGCSVATCQNAVCVQTHKLNGSRCEGGVCIAGECKLDRTPSPGDSDAGSGDNGGADGDASSPDPSGKPGSGSSDEDDDGGGLCSAAPGAPPSAPMAFSLAVLAGLGAWRRRQHCQ